MLRKRYFAWLTALVAISVCVAGLWIQSEYVGWTYEWRDPAGQRAGLLVSSHGQFFIQTCSLKPNRDFAPEGRRVMPTGYRVGANRDGDATVVAIDELAIPFCRPDPGTYIAYNSAGEFNFKNTVEDGATTTTRWEANWTEGVVAYWFALAMPWSFAGLVGLERLFVRRKRSASPLPSPPATS